MKAGSRSQDMTKHPKEGGWVLGVLEGSAREIAARKKKEDETSVRELRDEWGETRRKKKPKLRN